MPVMFVNTVGSFSIKHIRLRSSLYVVEQTTSFAVLEKELAHPSRANNRERLNGHGVGYLTVSSRQTQSCESGTQKYENTNINQNNYRSF